MKNFLAFYFSILRTIILIISPSVIMAQGTTCADAINITIPTTLTNQTACGKGADYVNYCGLSSDPASAGEEIVYVFTAPTSGFIEAILTGTTDGPGSTNDNVGFVLSTGSSTICHSTCIDSDFDDHGKDLVVNGNVTAGTTYYLTIDAGDDPVDCINFNLTVQYTIGNTCANAININIPVTLNNQTSCGKGSDYTSNYCGATNEFSNGQDVVYSFTATKDGCIKVNISNLVGTKFNNGFGSAIFEGACPGTAGSTCVGNGQVGWMGNGTISYRAAVEIGKTYYFLVDVGDKEVTNCVDFDFSIDYDECPPPVVTGNENGIDCGSNLGFEMGNETGWTGLRNDSLSHYSGPPINPPIVGFHPNPVVINGTLGACGAQNTTPPNNNTTATPRHTITTGTGKDPNTGNVVPIVAPGGGLYSFRLGSQEPYGGCECIQRTFTPNASLPIFTYMYAIVSNDEPWHDDNVKARFEMSLKDPQGNNLSCGGQYAITSGARIGDGFYQAPNSACGGTDTYYTPWRAVSVDLSSYIGQTLTIRFCTSDCSAQQHYSYAYIDAYCYPKAIKGTTLCSTGSSVTLTAPLGFTNYQWYTGGFPVSGSSIGTGQTLTIPNPVNGTVYTVTYEPLQKGLCATMSHTTDTIKVLSVSAAGDTTVCNNATGMHPIFASSNDPNATYSWSPSTNLSCTTCPNPIVTLPLANTTNYIVTITSPLGCSMTSDVTVTVLGSGCYTANATSATVCSGECATITASGNGGILPYTYSWSPSTGLSSTSGASVSACPTSTTTYTVLVTDNAGATATATSVVTVGSSLTITVPPATICNGTSTTLTASGANTYTWTPVTGLSSGTGSTVTANPTGTTTYTVTGTSSGCTGSTTVVVTVTNGPTITVNNGTTCGGIPVTLTVNGATTYTWSPATGLNTTSGSTVLAGPNTTTTYTVIGTTATGCSGSAIAIVTISPTPVADFTISPPGIVAPNTQITFTDISTNPGSPFWNFGDPLSGTDNNSLLSSPTHTYTTEGDYCITLTSTNTTSGCADTITKCIMVIGEAVIIFPNVFTPNNDGENDWFYFYTEGVSDLKCTIYDRWGLEMYEWNAVDGGWNGRAKNGKPAPDGVYYFIMEASPANGAELIKKHGFLHLLQEKAF